MWRYGWIVGTALLGGMLFAGCSGSNGNSGGAATTPQTAMPVISPNGGSIYVGQVISVTDATPGASITCTAPSGTVACAGFSFASGGTYTVTASASATGYTASATATATFTVTSQAMSWKPSSLNINAPNGTITVDSTVLASTCTGTSMAFAYPTGTNTTVLFSGSVIPTWTPTSSGSATGTIGAPTTLPQSKVSALTATATATCNGTSTSVSIPLQVTIVAPDAPTVSPSTAKSTSNTTFTLTSPNGTYMARNDSSLTTFDGTGANLQSTCTYSFVADTTWVTINSTQLGVSSNNFPTGPECMVVHTDSDNNGIGGGVASTPAAVTIVANVIVGIGGNAYAYVDTGTANTAGVLHVVSNGQQKDYAQGLGAGAPVYSSSTALVYVPNKYDSSVSITDPVSGAQSKVSTPGYAPVMLTAAPNGTVYAYAEHSDDPNRGEALRLNADGSFTVVSENVDRATSFIATSNGQLRWTVANPLALASVVVKPGEIHGWDLNASSALPVQYVDRQVDSLNQFADGSVIAYKTGDRALIALNPSTFAEEGVSTVPAGIWGVDAYRRVWLADGSIGSVAVAFVQGVRNATWSPVGLVSPAELMNGALVNNAHSQVLTALPSHAGSLAMQVHSLPQR